MSQTQDSIDAYVRGEMPPGERATFEQQMQGDAQLRAQYRLTEALCRELRERNGVEALARQWLSENQARAADEQQTAARAAAVWSGRGTNRRRRYGWCIALGVAAALLAAVLIIRSALSSPPGIGAELKGSSTLAADHNMPSAMSVADCVPPPSAPEKAKGPLAYIGLLVEQGAYSEALQACRSMQQMPSVVSEDNNAYELRWMEINLLLLTDAPEQARDLLRSYITEQGDHQAEALRLWNEMNQ